MSRAQGARVTAIDGQRLDPRQLAAALPEPREIPDRGPAHFSPRPWKPIIAVLLAGLLPIVFFPGSWWWLVLISVMAGALWSLLTDWHAPEILRLTYHDHEIYTRLRTETGIEDERSARVLHTGDRVCPSGSWKAAQRDAREGSGSTFPFDLGDLFAFPEGPAPQNSPRIRYGARPGSFDLVVAVKPPSRYSDQLIIGLCTGSSHEHNVNDGFQRKRARPLRIDSGHCAVAAAVADALEALEYGPREPDLAEYLRSHHPPDARERAERIMLAAKLAERPSPHGPHRSSRVARSASPGVAAASSEPLRPTHLGRLWLEADREVRSRAARDIVLAWLHERSAGQHAPAKVEDFPDDRRGASGHFLSYRDVLTASRSLREEGLIEWGALDPLHGRRAWPTARGLDCVRQGGDVSAYLEGDHRKTEGIHVSIQQININGDVVNSNVVAASVIENSSIAVGKASISDELRILLSELHKSVAVLTAELPEDEAALAAHDLEALTIEATSPTPRRAFWRRAAHGLLAAAGTAAVGIPVVDLVNKIVALIT